MMKSRNRRLEDKGPSQSEEQMPRPLEQSSESLEPPDEFPNITALEELEPSPIVPTAFLKQPGLAGKPLKSHISMLEAIHRSPAMNAAARVAEAINNNPGLKAAAAAAEAIHSNSALTAAMTPSQAINDSPGMRAARLATEALSSSPSMRLAAEFLRSSALTSSAAIIAMKWNSGSAGMVSAQTFMPANSGSISNPAALLETIRGSSAMKTAAAAAAALSSTPALIEATRVMDAILNQPGLRAATAMFEALNTSAVMKSATAVMQSWNEQESPLLAYLAAQNSNDFGSLVEATGIARARAFATGDAVVLRIKPRLEEEIVERLQQGEAVDQLPERAWVYLRKALHQLHLVIEFMLLVIAVWQAYDFVQGKLSPVEQPSEVRAVISQLPPETRELLAGYRVVIRERVLLRAEASTKSDVLGRLQMGAVVEVLEEGDRWVKVSVEVFGEEKEGWIYRSYTVPIKASRKQP